MVATGAGASVQQAVQVRAAIHLSPPVAGGVLARVPGDFGLVDHVWPVRYEQALRDGRQRLAHAGTVVPASAGELVCAVIRRLPDLTLAARWLAATPPPAVDAPRADAYTAPAGQGGDEFAIALTLTHDALMDLAPRDGQLAGELLAHARLRAHWLLSAAGENEDGQDELVLLTALVKRAGGGLAEALRTHTDSRQAAREALGSALAPLLVLYLAARTAAAPTATRPRKQAA